MRLKILAAIILCVVLGYVLFWYYMAGELEDRVEDWSDQQKSQGISVGFADSEIAGFPYRLELSFKNLKVIKTGQDELPVLFTSPRITYIAFPWRISHGVIVSEGGGLRIGRRRHPEMLMGFGKSRASLVMDPVSGEFQRASFVLAGVTWAAGQNARNQEPSRAGEVKLHLMRPASAGQSNEMELPVQMKLYLEVNELDLMRTDFEDKLEQVKIDLQLHGEEFPGYSRESLALWRDHGGTLAVKNIAVTSGDMDIELGGEVTLDQDLKPLGAFSAKLHAAALATYPLFQGAPGKLILQELDSMRQQQADKETVDLAISLQGGLLYFGSIPVYELAPIVE